MEKYAVIDDDTPDEEQPAAEKQAAAPADPKSSPLLRAGERVAAVLAEKR